MTWTAKVEKDKKNLDLQNEMVESRNKWRRIHMDDHCILVHVVDSNFLRHFCCCTKYLLKSDHA